ncbi:MAG TPA: HPr family phosphocarrier protein [Chthoniobacterales bacterium]|nr:HPr family phosphocarrier protein [Chthoniobacterales bacterium]
MLKWGRTKREPVSVSREVIVTNELGLHARPAAEFARKANSFRSEIAMVRNGERFSATSVIDILRANLERGAQLTLEAHGVDAEEAVSALEKVLSELRD